MHHRLAGDHVGNSRNRYGRKTITPATDRIELERNYQKFRVRMRFEHQAAMALMKRLPKMTANYALAMIYSLGLTFKSFLKRFKTTQWSFIAVSSVRKWPLARIARQPEAGSCLPIRVQSPTSFRSSSHSHAQATSEPPVAETIARMRARADAVKADRGGGKRLFFSPPCISKALARG
jgi:hypothetical protein